MLGARHCNYTGYLDLKQQAEMGREETWERVLVHASFHYRPVSGEEAVNYSTMWLCPVRG
jgi:hypothetical protein